MAVFLPGIYLIALLFGLFLISLLLKNRTKNSANLYMAALVLSLMLTLWNASVQNLELPSALQFRILDYVIYASAYFWGPLLYLYVGKLTKQHPDNKRYLLKHLLIPGTLTLSQIPLTIWGLFPFFFGITLTCFVLYLGFYIYLSVKCLARHEERIHQTFSEVESIQLTWLKNLIQIFIAVLCVDFSISYASLMGIITYAPVMDLVIFMESCTIFAVGYFSLKQPQIIFPQEEANEDATKKKYGNSALDAPLSKDLAEQLMEVMKNDQPYRRNDLKLGDLAELMGLSNHHLSQVINERIGCNFYEFVNQYRIEYAATLMRANKQTNITNLAFDAGFNNRVSFTNAFKKKIGVTPSTYMKQQVFKQAS